jgi:hypothetical protein
MWRHKEKSLYQPGIKSCHEALEKVHKSGNVKSMSASPTFHWIIWLLII